MRRAVEVRFQRRIPLVEGGRHQVGNEILLGDGSTGRRVGWRWRFSLLVGRFVGDGRVGWERFQFRRRQSCDGAEFVVILEGKRFLLMLLIRVRQAGEVGAHSAE